MVCPGFRFVTSEKEKNAADALDSLNSNVVVPHKGRFLIFPTSAVESFAIGARCVEESVAYDGAPKENNERLLAPFTKLLKKLWLTLDVETLQQKKRTARAYGYRFFAVNVFAKCVERFYASFSMPRRKSALVFGRGGVLYCRAVFHTGAACLRS